MVELADTTDLKSVAHYEREGSSPSSEIMRHLKEVNMSYVRHLLHAMSISMLLFIAGFCCLVHSVLPPVFETVASDIIKHINDNILKR